MKFFYMLVALVVLSATSLHSQEGKLTEPEAQALIKEYRTREIEARAKIAQLKPKLDSLKKLITELDEDIETLEQAIEALRKTIIDLEVNRIFNQEHGQLPAATRQGQVADSNVSIVNIQNFTIYELTVWYSGPESFKLVFTPKEEGAIELLSREYRVAAKVSNPLVIPYAGTQSYNGNYIQIFYIEPGIRPILPIGWVQYPFKRRISEEK